MHRASHFGTPIPERKASPVGPTYRDETFEDIRDSLLDRMKARVGRVEAHARKTGQLDLSKAFEEDTPPTRAEVLTNAERFLDRFSLRKDLARGSPLYEAVDRTKARIRVVKQLTNMNDQWPAPNLEADIRRETLALVKDLRWIQADLAERRTWTDLARVLDEALEGAE